MYKIWKIYFWQVTTVDRFPSIVTAKFEHSWVWGFDRKIRLDDHRLASLGLPSDDKRWSRERIFLSRPYTNNVFISCSLNTSFMIKKKKWKNLPENSEYAEMQHGDLISTLQWRHGSRTDSVSFPKTGTGMREKWYFTWVKTTEIPIWCARTISLKHVVSGFLKVMVQSVLFSTALWCRYKHQFTLTDTSDNSILNNESEKRSEIYVIDLWTNQLWVIYRSYYKHFIA